MDGFVGELESLESEGVRELGSEGVGELGS